jgi:twitching motility protein PilT
MHRIDISGIEPFLEALWAAGGSDLLLTAASAPRLRIDGRLVPLPGAEVLAGTQAEDLILGMLDDERRAEFRQRKELDFGFTWGDRARCRGNVYFQSGEVALALRVIPVAIPSFEDLNLPPKLAEFCALPQGLVLFTGPTGSGKSTSLAAMIDRVNRSRPCHILTIEDPIEYVHTHQMAMVSQREVGIDTDSFPQALRAALREDPDVILVGEMRDLETIQFALTIAETGHLVFATLHTNDAAQAIDRVSDMFPPDRQTQIRVQLAASLSGVVAQRLVPRAGGGMVAAFEILVGTSAVRGLVREGKTHQIRNTMMSSVADGMQTLEMSLNQLVAAGLVSADDAIARAIHPKEIRLPMRRAS